MEINNPKPLIFVLTIAMDVIILYILKNQHLNCFDEQFAVAVLACHLIFLYAIHKNISSVVDCLHCMIFIALGLGVFLENRYLLLMCLVLLIVIHVLWWICGECIINRISRVDQLTPETSNSIEILAMAFTFIYLCKLFF